MTPCTQPNCAGHLEDGYCNLCGLAAPKPATRSGTISTATGSTPVSRPSNGQRRSIPLAARASRRNLGAGIVTVPALPATEPEDSLLAEPKVPDHKRFCSKCDRPLTRDKGYCGQCGQKYSFIPTLKPGDVVHGQYEVRGAIAYGGLGWIYLAFDKILSRHVVLKGLLNTEDAGAAAVALAERQFLAAVKHPNIVGIYNFVQQGHEGFIVMEYVGGMTLRDIRRARGPLPAAEAIAYIHRILGALGYLHEQKLVFCDFKPENVMLEGDDVKLIDLGGVRRIDDLKGDIYGTEGYSAPEAGDGPTVASDLYTVGRSLAVLLAEIRAFTKENRYSLPAAAEEPVFARHESLFRFLLKATAANPDDRFISAEEMASQLLGVLREVVAVETGTPQPAASPHFSGDMLPLLPSDGIEPIVADHRQLPQPILRPVFGQRALAVETRLRLAENSAPAEAFAILRELESEDPWEWRARWHRARLLLAQGNAADAQQLFDQIYFELPGELAPKIGFAMAAERAGNLGLAARLYDIVSRTDPNHASACFGLARCLAAEGERKGAIEALNRVPQTSSLYVRSRMEAARVLVSKNRSIPTPEDFAAASAAIESLSVHGIERHRLSQLIYGSALDLVLSRALPQNPAIRILGRSLREDDLRLGLEQSYRALAHLTAGPAKIKLVDAANRVRPRTLF
ncbi:MAG: tetratricopeptide repeat protein [Acidobacteriota bacterium]|nr:tetratricopeptide repeat protein [Acidobacteriota bacterium]